jgi:hypothetical protein
VPETQPGGPANLAAEFDSGPLAGLLHATMTIEVRK